MSDLKHLNIVELRQRKASCEKYIGKLTGKINNEETRLNWINHYIRIQTPKEMTVAEIERALGSKIKIIS